MPGVPPQLLTGDFAAFGTDCVRMRYKEPWVSEGLNRMMAVVAPKGIYRGFRLVASLVAGQATVQADPTNGDHMAVVHQSSGPALTVELPALGGGDFTLTFDNVWAGKMAVVVLETDYTVGSPTTAYVTAYETDALGTGDWDLMPALNPLVSPADKASKIVLGWCDIADAGGVAGIVTVHLDGREDAWLNQPAPGTVPWIPLLKNPGFEDSDDATSGAGHTAGWECNAPTIVSMYTDQVAARSGKRSLACVASAAAAPAYGQQIIYPVVPGQMVRVEFWKKVISACAGGTVSFRISTLTQAFAGSSNLDLVTVATDAVDADWVKVSAVIEIPATKYFLWFPRLIGSGLTSPPAAALGTVIVRLDDVQLWAEPVKYPDVLDDALKTRDTLALMLRSIGLTDRGAKLQYGLSGDVELGKPDGTAVDLSVFGSILAGAQQAASDSDSDLPRFGCNVTSGGISLKTLLFDSRGSLGPMVRVYMRRDAGNSAVGFEITLNALWANATNTFTKDTDGEESAQLILETIGSTSFQLNLRRAADAGPWLDNAWTYSALNAAIEDMALVGSTGVLDWVGSLVLGTGLVGGAAQAETPRIKMDRSSQERTLLSESGFPGAAKMRVYRCNSNDPLSNGETIETTINAVWDNTTGLWSRDVAQSSSRQVQYYDHVRVETHWKNAADGWTDVEFNSGDTGGVTPFALGNRILLRPGNPAVVNANPDEITCNNIIKAWGSFRVSGGALELLDFGEDAGVGHCAYNSFPALVGPAPNPYVEVTLFSPMATINSYSVFLQVLCEGGARALSASCIAEPISNSKFRIHVYRGDTGLLSDFDTLDPIAVSYQVVGRQSAYSNE